MSIKESLDDAIQRFEIIPVGWGYIDLITRKEMISPFIRELNSLDIKIKGFTWWCFADGKNPACPHGMGGPLNEYGDGWFSEIELGDVKVFPALESTLQNNGQYGDYILSVYPNEDGYKPCFTPGFWLSVPDGWRNAYCG